MKFPLCSSVFCCVLVPMLSSNAVATEPPTGAGLDAGAGPDALGAVDGGVQSGAASAAQPTPTASEISAPAPATAPTIDHVTTEDVSTQALTPGTGEVFMPIGTVDVVVSGTRSRALDLPGSVDVIGEEQTSKEVTSTALDLMRRIPGFAFQDYGNGGTPNGFMLRGFSSNHGVDTLVVIDGVPINEHGWYGQDDGAPDLNQLSAEEIESIEVIKGPLDARFGNWGRSGVILIQTRQKGDFLRANSSIGSYGYKKQFVSFGSEHLGGRFNQVYSAEFFQNDGWRENSAQQRQNAYAKWFYRPSSDLRLGLITHMYKGDWSTGSYIDQTQWDRDPRQAFSGAANDGGYKQLMEAALHVDAKLFGRVPLKAVIWHKETKNSRYADWTYEGKGQTEDHAAEGVNGAIVNAESDWTPSEGQTLRVDAGVDYRYFRTNGTNWNTQARVRQTVNSDDRYNFQNGGAYLKASYDIARRVRISGGIREDLFWGDTTNRMTATGSTMKTYSVPTYKLGLVGNVLRDLSVYGNLGTTYRLPSQATKYDKNPPPVAGLFFWEAGLKAKFQDLVLFRYAYFQSKERESTLVQAAYVDNGNAKRAGHELELSLGPWKNIELFTALTVHNAHYDGGPNDGKTVPIIPSYILKGGVQADTPWGTGARLNFNIAGKWDTDAENTHSYGGYHVVDFSVYQVFDRNWSLAFDVKNLFDLRYSEFVSYWSDSNQYMPSNPRTLFASLRYATR
jgi:iron complex outermembrane recepter protein